jgi:high affinity Mn2+ porin
MIRLISETLRNLPAVALMLFIHGQTLVAQDAPSVARSEPAPAKAPDTTGSNWTGFYFGAQTGVAGGSSAWSATQPGGRNLSGSLDIFHAYDLSDGSGSHFGGLTAGYNRELPSRLVIGLEADASFGAEPVVGAPFNHATEAFGTVRGRIGYESNQWLYFTTSGLAWTRERFSRTTVSGTGGGSPAGTADDAAFGGRIGWTVGGGFEAPVGRGWKAKAEYLYSRFGSATVAFPLGGSFTSDLSLHQFRVGVNYKVDDGPKPDRAPLGIVALDLDKWSVHGQTTFLSQYAAPFHAPYSGPNSLASDAGRETWDATLYLGRRLWEGAELWINPEIDQGFGLSNTLGVAGFTSGEAYKVGFAHPYLRVPRVFVRQTFNLGGAIEKQESGLNQFSGSQTANRLVVTAGKFSVSDLFDTVTYAHDPRNDFMNWALADAGTFDYAADAWSFTYGAAVEWYQRRWTARSGLFDLSIVPNSIELDNFGQFQLVYELEHRHELRGRPGKVAVAGFSSRGRMGSFDDAVGLSQQTGTPASTANVRRYNGRPGVNVNAEQQLAPGVGVFGRVGWANGRLEPYEFTDIDRTVSGGLSLGGNRWGRPDDTFGLVTVVNDISDAHVAYFNAGGLGILVGDGQLPHPGLETIVETYYRLPLGPWQVTADYQFIVNPAYNRDRGPVSVIAARLRAQF